MFEAVFYTGQEFGDNEWRDVYGGHWCVTVIPDHGSLRQPILACENEEEAKKLAKSLNKAVTDILGVGTID